MMKSKGNSFILSYTQNELDLRIQHLYTAFTQHHKKLSFLLNTLAIGQYNRDSIKRLHRIDCDTIEIHSRNIEIKFYKNSFGTLANFQQNIFEFFSLCILYFVKHNYFFQKIKKYTYKLAAVFETVFPDHIDGSTNRKINAHFFVWFVVTLSSQMGSDRNPFVGVETSAQNIDEIHRLLNHECGQSLFC